jgi:hypothetical protein
MYADLIRAGRHFFTCPAVAISPDQHRSITPRQPSRRLSSGTSQLASGERKVSPEEPDFWVRISGLAGLHNCSGPRTAAPGFIGMI